MPVASGIYKTTSWKKQSGLGSAVSGAGGKTARRVTSNLKADRDTFESNEIVNHHQSTGVSYGLHKADGSIDGLLSAGTFADHIGSILEKDFATGVNSTALTITYGGTLNAWTATRAAGSFLTDGFKVGDVFRASAGSVTANNTRNFFVTSVVALAITFRALDGAAVAAGSSTTTTLTVAGKKTWAPTSGHTKDYYGLEDWYADVSKSELFNDMRVGQVAINLPATGNATIKTDFVGLSRTKGVAQVLTAPVTTTTPPMCASNGVILINGAAQSIATSLSFTISNSAANAGAVIGSNNGQDVTTGRIKVSGTFMAQFDSTTLSDLYSNETTTSINVVITADNTGTSDFVAFTLPRIKITSDAADDGEKAIIRTYAFTAEYNAVGGTGVASEQTIMSAQDSAA